MGKPETATARPGGPPGSGNQDGGQELRSIGALSELAAIVRAQREAYLRHSLGPAADGQERSCDYESGLELPGLSVVPLQPPDWWQRPLADWLARQICKYARLSEADGWRFAWVLTGKVTGAGQPAGPAGRWPAVSRRVPLSSPTRSSSRCEVVSHWDWRTAS